MRYWFAVPLTLLTLAALADVAQAARILSVRDLTANPERYHGQYVTVRAFGIFAQHTYKLLQDEDRLYKGQDMRLEDIEKDPDCLTVTNRDENRNRFRLWNRRTLTVSGHFTASVNWEQNYFGCGMGHVWGLAIEKVLSVRGPIFPVVEYQEIPPFALGNDVILTGEEPQFTELKHWQRVLLKDEEGEPIKTRFARNPQWGFVLRSSFKTPYGDGALSLWRDSENVVHYSTAAGLPEELE